MAEFITRFLSDYEALVVAMDLEKEGYEFYNYTAKNSKAESTREIFKKLAKDELEHYALFKKALNDTARKNPRGEPLADDIGLYLHSLIDTGIFNQKRILKKSLKNLSDIEAISIGIQSERDSILFYKEALDASTNPSGKRIFGFLISVEKKHLAALRNKQLEIVKNKK